MHMSKDNHYPKLKRKSLAGGPCLNRFMGRVIPPSAAEADMKTGQHKTILMERLLLLSALTELLTTEFKSSSWIQAPLST